MKTTSALSKIPFLDLRAQNRQLKAEIMQAIEKVMNESAFILGPFAEQFEKELAAYCGVRHAAGVSSGTSALHLAMLALGVKPGDEVLVPANTYIATAWGVSHAGGTPVFVDCDAATWNMDAKKAEAKISAKTKAIIGVHLYGQPCDIGSLIAVSKKHGIHFVEDAAQAQGAIYGGKRTGSFGELACFSFYPGKNLGAYGDAGAVTSDKVEYIERIKRLRNQGAEKKYFHEEIGYNERLDGIQAAVLSVKLKYLDGWNNRRKEIAQMYRDGISHPSVKMQQPQPDAEPVCHLFVVTVENRDAMMRHLNERNIFPGMHYPLPCHLQKAYAKLGYKKGDFPNAEFLAEHCLSLPMYPELSDDDVSRVIEAVNEFGK